MSKTSDIINKDNQPSLSPWEELKLIDAKKTELLNRMVTDLAKQLDSLGKNYKSLIDVSPALSLWTDPQFTQSLEILGLAPVGKSSTKAPRKASKASGEAPKSIKDSPKAVELLNVIKKAGTAVDKDHILKALPNASGATVSNYLGKLVKEGVLHQPARGQFALV